MNCWLVDALLASTLSVATSDVIESLLGDGKVVSAAVERGVVVLCVSDVTLSCVVTDCVPAPVTSLLSVHADGDVIMPHAVVGRSYDVMSLSVPS